MGRMRDGRCAFIHGICIFNPSRPPRFARPPIACCKHMIYYDRVRREGLCTVRARGCVLGGSVIFLDSETLSFPVCSFLRSHARRVAGNYLHCAHSLVYFRSFARIEHGTSRTLTRRGRAAAGPRGQMHMAPRVSRSRHLRSMPSPPPARPAYMPHQYQNTQRPNPDIRNPHMSVK